MRCRRACQVAAWAGIAGLAHGFFGRRGGVSDGELGALNVSDARRRPARLGRHQLGADPRRAARPGHRPHAAGPRDAGCTGRRARSDGGRGRRHGHRPAGHGLAVLTADCVRCSPARRARGAVMAVHAGWRGSLAGTAPAAASTRRASSTSRRPSGDSRWGRRSAGAATRWRPRSGGSSSTGGAPCRMRGNRRATTASSTCGAPTGPS